MRRPRQMCIRDRGKSDPLEGMKENVICGHLIPAGTGLREYDNLVVGSREDDVEILAEYGNTAPVHRGVETAELIND